MAAIVRSCQQCLINAHVGCVASTSAQAPGIQTATDLGVPTKVIKPPREDAGHSIVEAFEGCDLICLAGFLLLVPSAVLQKWPHRILNIHPALLPKFGGKGMYGQAVHEAVIAAGEVESGCTVHFVTEDYDEGDIILQERCPVLPTDTPESLAERVLVLEHVAYSKAIQRVLDEL